MQNKGECIMFKRLTTLLEKAIVPAKDDVQKLGATGALLMGIYFVWILVFVIVLLPGQGLTTPEDLNDPVKALLSWSNSPVLYLFNLADLLIAIALALVVPALYRL